MRAKLRVAKGSNAGKNFEINVPQFVIGRAAGCQLRPQSDAISRQHCAILLHADHVSVRDLKSRNGTFLNGDRIASEERLATGDELQVGPLVFEVIVTDDAGVLVRETAPSVVEHEVAGLPGDSGLISDWLMEDEARQKGGPLPETRQFKLDETSLVPAPTIEATAADAKKTRKDKPEPGKLPKQQQDAAANSRDAAAETLRRMFQRGS